MADQKVTVIMEPAAWSEEAESALAGATGNDPTYTLGDLQHEIESGTATLYLVTAGNERLGWLVLWVENFGGTRELVIQSGAAIGREPRALRMAMPAIEKLGRSLGCSTMRAHLTDGARLRAMRRSGFSKAETVMRKAL